MTENLGFGVLIVLSGTTTALVIFLVSNWKRQASGAVAGEANATDKLLVGILGLLFLSYLIGLYAFQQREWAADLLKVIVGMIAGGTAAAAANSIQQQITGNNNFQAVNAQIDSVKADLSKIENAIIGTQQLSESIYEKASVSADTIGRHVSQYGAQKYISYGSDNEGLRLHPRDVCTGSNEEVQMINLLRNTQSRAGRDGFAQYVVLYDQKPLFHAKLREFVEGLEAQGRFVTSCSLDSIEDFGLLVLATFERRLPY
jgi:hypothetical protein